MVFYTTVLITAVVDTQYGLFSSTYNVTGFATMHSFSLTKYHSGKCGTCFPGEKLLPKPNYNALLNSSQPLRAAAWNYGNKSDCCLDWGRGKKRNRLHFSSLFTGSRNKKEEGFVFGSFTVWPFRKCHIFAIEILLVIFRFLKRRVND